MEKGIKKGHPRATKLTDEPNHKRPLYGFCYTHFNMKEEHLTDIEHQFLSALPDGRDNAVTLLKLSRTLHINKHKVSEIVARLRNAGYLVGSSKSRPNGVYFIITAQEFWETVNTINKSIQSQQATLDALMNHEERFTRE
ncbi:MarR family transcriptional regulator [Leuconostoc suionicum]|uniref:MarR family transcriptional regulator n=1 Tax=Leuconostoc suionicum TaxID=1511761 RepID=UPI003C49C37F